MEDKKEGNVCETDPLSADTANLSLTDDSYVPLPLRHIIGFNGQLRGGLIVHAMGQHIIYTVGFNIIIECVGGPKTGTQEVLAGHTGIITAIAMSGDGRFLVSGQETRQETKSPIILWDWSSRQKLLNIALHKRQTESLAFSCITKIFVSLGGQDDGSVAVWSTALRKPLVSQVAQIERAGIMHCLAASKIDEHVFATGGDSYGRIWTFDPHDHTLSFVEFKFGPYVRIIICMEMVDLDYSRLPLLFCGTTSGDIVVIHGRTGVFQFTVPGKPFSLGVTALSYIRMGKEEVFCVLVGTGEGKVGYYTITRQVGTDRKVSGIMKLCEGKTQWQDERESTSITSVSKIGEGNSFFVGTKDCKIYRFNVEKWKAELVRTCSRTAIRAMAFPRGTDELLVTGEHTMVRVHNLRQLLEVRRYIRANRTCMALAVNHDGTQIFSGWDEGTTIVLGFAPKDLSLSELYRIQCTHKQAVTSLDLTSKSDVLVSGGDDGQCRVWRLVDDLDMRGKRLRQGLLLFHLTSQSGPITKVQVSENDEMCVSSSVDGSAVMYDLSRGLKKGGIKVDLGLTSVSFCSNDLHLITCGGDGKIYFWEIKSGECLRILEACTFGGIFCLDVEKKDKKLFACSGEDRLVKLWCLDEARVSHMGHAHSDIVLKVKFGPCGTVLVSGAKDGSICVWDVPKVECS